MSIPAIFMNAYLRGRCSCRNRAKGIVVSASSATMKILIWIIDGKSERPITAPNAP